MSRLAFVWFYHLFLARAQDNSPNKHEGSEGLQGEGVDKRNQHQISSVYSSSYKTHSFRLNCSLAHTAGLKIDQTFIPGTLFALLLLHSPGRVVFP